MQQQDDDKINFKCDNLWGISTITNTASPLYCQNCANWLPDIEDLGNVKSCRNRWPIYIINTPRTELRPPS